MKIDKLMTHQKITIKQINFIKKSFLRGNYIYLDREIPLTQSDFKTLLSDLKKIYQTKDGAKKLSHPLAIYHVVALNNKIEKISFTGFLISKTPLISFKDWKKKKFIEKKALAQFKLTSKLGIEFYFVKDGRKVNIIT